MKRAVSILILLTLLLFIFEFGVIYLKKGHEVSYQVFYQDKVFNVTEIYQKNNGNTYDIKIENDNNVFYYSFENKYNKQKKIIDKIEYFNEDNNICIYPVLINNENSYIECISNNKLYTATSYSNQNYITNIKKILEEKGYPLTKISDTKTINEFNNTIIYKNNLLANDTINLWSYKGINVINSEKEKQQLILPFDKYENNHGILVDKYYIIPKYFSNRVLEFSSIFIIDVTTNILKTLDLGYTLSSKTYINGIVDNKLYYTDPSNLLQIEINPAKSNIRLIGNKEIGGQLYNGNWNNANIYDFASNKIKFEVDNNEIKKFDHVEYVDSNNSYYFYNNKSEVYQVSKNYLDKPVLLFKTNDINNFEVIDNTIYFISSDTLYYYNNTDGIIPVLKNNDLKYNKTNRVEIYRKS